MLLWVAWPVSIQIEQLSYSSSILANTPPERREPFLRFGRDGLLPALTESEPVQRPRKLGTKSPILPLHI